MPRLPRPTPLGALLAGLFAVACVGVERVQNDGGPPIRPEGTPPPHADPATTEVLLHARRPTVAGKDSVWSAAVQLAWDALADRLGQQGRMVLGPPANAEDVEALNDGRMSVQDLDPASFVVEAGLLKDGLVARFQAAVARLGGASFPLEFGPLDEGAAAALACIRKEMRFRQPFHVHERLLAFAGGPARVVSFGIDEDATGRDVDRMREQVTVIGPEGADPYGRIGVALRPEDDADRIVLAMLPRPATLEDGWREVSSWLARPEPKVERRLHLQIPKIDFAADRDFRELVPAIIRNSPPPTWYLAGVGLGLELTLSEKGARFVSFAWMTAQPVGPSPYPPPPPTTRIVFDRPFLMALLRHGAHRPYFLAWFETDHLFVKG